MLIVIVRSSTKTSLLSSVGSSDGLLIHRSQVRALQEAPFFLKYLTNIKTSCGPVAQAG